MDRLVAGCSLVVLALACTSSEPRGELEGDGGEPALGLEMRPFGAPCTDSSQCEYRACVEVAAGRTVCSGGCMERTHCPVGPNWDCLPAPDLGAEVRVCGCLSDSDDEICGDGLDNDCDAVVDCPESDARAGEPDDAGTDAGDAGNCPATGCAPDASAPPSCATDPGLCPACAADIDCDDGIACTADHCRARGCVHVPTDTACAAGQICDLRMDGCARARACATAADCVDEDACTQAEHCDTAAAVCRFVLLDGDGDEHHPAVCGGDDCDDTNSASYPGALDVCDGADNDCNGSVDPVSAALLCAEGRACSGGSCACADGTVACAGGCLPAEQFMTDEANCGVCGTVCATGLSCEEGLCADIDECAQEPAPCGEHGTCVNSSRTYSCSCDDGYAPTGVGGFCVDRNECNQNSDDCDDFPDACSNAQGSFACQCPAGYSGTGVGSEGCVDIDECTAGTDDCQGGEICADIPGGFTCMQPALAVAAGSSATCAILSGQRVKCWGDNSYGQLGIGNNDTRGDGAGEMGASLPYVDLGAGKTAKAVASGSSHNCALLNDDTVKCWGLDEYGQLGQESQAPIGDEPSDMGSNLLPVALGNGRTAKAIATGGAHTCALLDDNTVKCWGNNDFGQLGLGNTDARSDGVGEMGQNLPPVDLGDGHTAKAIAVGDAHSCALLDDDAVKCWGNNLSGQLGQGTNDHRGDAGGEMGNALLPIALGDGRTAKQITAGVDHTCALLDDDTVKCWGGNDYGQLGRGDTDYRGDGAGEMGNALTAVNVGTDREVKAVSAGAWLTCALLDDNSVKCWGMGSYGQLGQGSYDSRGDNGSELGNQLLPIALGTGRTGTAVSAGFYHVCALLDDQTVKCWGDNSGGRLGLGDQNSRGAEPNQMGDFLPAVDVGPP